MTDTVFCRSCGEPLAADSRFCEHCGTEQVREEGSRLALPKPISDAREHVETIAPGAGELFSQLATQLRTPTVATALIGGAMAAGLMFAIALIFGLILSDRSMIGLVNHGKGLVTAGFAQMIDFVQAGWGDGVGKLGPALFVVFPIGSCAVAAASQARRTLGLAPPVRLISGAGVGLVFGLLMLVPALGAGGLGGGQSLFEPDALGTVALGALWGVLGGLGGTYYVVRTALPPDYFARLLPAVVREVARTVGAALRPLVLLLVLMLVVGTAVWTVETLLKSDLRQGNSTPVAVIDNMAYAVEHGVQWTELAGLAQFRIPGGAAAEGSAVEVPVPVGDISKLKVNSSGQYRLFGLSHAMPTYTFAPLLIFLLASALLLAFFAGASVAQVRVPQTPWAAAAWGCLVGPIWALAMVIVNGLVAKEFFGRADGGSVFGSFLLGGLIVGAVGGLASVQAQRRQAPSAADAGVAGIGSEAGRSGPS
jgi:hypothetical protein